jgi:hypothetical protein
VGAQKGTQERFTVERLGDGEIPPWSRDSRDPEDEKRLVISDYFLNEDNFGKLHAEGDHKIHVAKVTRDDLTLDIINYLIE